MPHCDDNYNTVAAIRVCTQPCDHKDYYQLCHFWEQVCPKMPLHANYYCSSAVYEWSYFKSSCGILLTLIFWNCSSSFAFSFEGFQ